MEYWIRKLLHPITTYLMLLGWYWNCIVVKTLDYKRSDVILLHQEEKIFESLSNIVFVCVLLYSCSICSNGPSSVRIWERNESTIKSTELNKTIINRYYEAYNNKRVMSKRELDNINNQIILPRRIMYQLSTTYTKKRNEIA